MSKIKDRIFLGFLSGMLGAIPGRLLNKAEFKLGITDSRYEEMAASLFVRKRDIHKPKGKNVGKIANSLLSSMIGVATTYVLSRTGRDHAMIKGMGVSSLAWLGIYGFSTQAQIRKTQKPGVALLSFLDHLIFGATTATLVTKLGDASIFPAPKDIDSKLEKPMPSYNNQLGFVHDNNLNEEPKEEIYLH